MDYYIQGSPERSEEIKAAFEKLGYDTYPGNFNNKYLLYFTFGGKISDCAVGGNFEKIIKTHPDYKELELPVETKFKAGDEIKTGNTIETIAEVDLATRSYCCESGRTIYFANQDLWELDTKPHYDIKNFHAGMPVLARDRDNQKWCYLLYSHYDNTYEDGLCFNAGSLEWRQCIPFEGNEHLLGTTDMCDERFINW